MYYMTLPAESASSMEHAFPSGVTSTTDTMQKDYFEVEESLGSRRGRRVEYLVR
jgi:hypothetical protein